MRTSLIAFSLLACIAVPTLARTQCTTTWRTGDGMPGVDGVVFASTLWDPDGAGPMAPRIVYVGSFDIAGTLSQCGDIAMQDTVTGEWFAASSGTNGFVHCVVASPTGELVIGGEFTAVGGVPANNVAAWDGSQWMAVGIGGGINGAVYALTFLSTGDMVAGGTFTTVTPRP